MQIPALAGLLGTLILCVGLRAQAPPPVTAGPNAPPAPTQPLPYSHRFHVGDLGLDCADCHTNPGGGKLMTYPPTETCASCHRTNPAGSKSLQLLVTMAGSQKPIPWVRVYQVPDYVFWQHGPHLAAKVACVECHGPVAERDVLSLETDVTTMRGCQRCHEKRQVFTDCGDCHEPRQ
ncbi:MAG: cytochrome c3 family protein [Acidobacteriota bacterium]